VGADLCLGDPDDDTPLLAAAIAGLRTRLPEVPEDPHLLLPEEPAETSRREPDLLPPAGEVVATILGEARGLDLVGLHAQGAITRGFAGSRGQRHWYETTSFATDFSLVYQADKAVKSTLAGFRWSARELRSRIESARGHLAVLARPPRRIPPGRYRAFLEPAALAEVLWLLGGEGFSLRAQRHLGSPLVKLAQGERALSEAVTLVENFADGLAPAFSEDGFPRPARVPLIVAGRHAGALVSPRSAREFGVQTNGADAHEAPCALDLAPGSLPTARALEALGEGVWVGNLWYTNFSDRPACRITGMTRFATFWVEGGRLAAPLEVMRFDETLYELLGTDLEALTAERRLLPSTETYFRRSTASARLPGALLAGFTFTL
jgi:predicted Zn-dependent protease